MFVRSELKSQAKMIVKRKYFTMVLVCLVSLFLSVSMLNVQYNVDNKTAIIYLFEMFSFSVNYDKAVMMAIPIVIIGILWRAFVVNPATVGVTSFFQHCSFDCEKFEDIWSGFKGNYAHHIKTMFVMDVRIFLYTLMLVIPGIMKSYSYVFVPYLLNDYPEKDTEEILKMSEQMAKGIRFQIFVLGLSFILWYVLAAVLSLFTFGMGQLFVEPYVSQTYAQLYLWAKENRLNSQSESDFYLYD